jgi:hypothetical protein
MCPGSLCHQRGYEHMLCGDIDISVYNVFPFSVGQPELLPQPPQPTCTVLSVPLKIAVILASKAVLRTQFVQNTMQ